VRSTNWESIPKAQEVSFLSHTLEKPQQPEFCSVQAERISVGAFASPRINELCKVALALMLCLATMMAFVALDVWIWFPFSHQ
jgi:hypothetical protein